MAKAKDRVRSLLGLMESVSFREDTQSGLEAISVMRSRLEDIGITLYDCEDMAQGLLELQVRMGPSRDQPQDQEVGADDVD